MFGAKPKQVSESVHLTQDLFASTKLSELGKKGDCEWIYSRDILNQIGWEEVTKMSDALQRAIAAIRSGDKETGQRLLAQVIRNDPHNENAWLWMSLM